MSERKVLNKYYPPDFDPSKIPRMKLAKNRQYTVRLMAPFNMRCKTCGEYIYRGKKFNARKEDVENDDYCGIRIYRFYIKCTRCLQEISFKTDPQNTDYVIEAGATRNFMALKLAQEQEERQEEEQKEEEANNPMKLLENRTEQSKQELELLESLEELRELNRRHYNIDFDSLLAKYDTADVKQKLLQIQKEKDDKVVDTLLKNKRIKLSSSTVTTTTISTEEKQESMDLSSEIIVNDINTKTNENTAKMATNKKVIPTKKLLSNLVQTKTSVSKMCSPLIKDDVNNAKTTQVMAKSALSLLESYSDSE